ncbi:hypothetical protein OQA88_2280 [Cercophora sp. LCS_1]
MDGPTDGPSSRAGTDNNAIRLIASIILGPKNEKYSAGTLPSALSGWRVAQNNQKIMVRALNNRTTELKRETQLLKEADIEFRQELESLSVRLDEGLRKVSEQSESETFAHEALDPDLQSLKERLEHLEAMVEGQFTRLKEAASEECTQEPDQPIERQLVELQGKPLQLEAQVDEFRPMSISEAFGGRRSSAKAEQTRLIQPNLETRITQQVLTHVRETMKLQHDKIQSQSDQIQRLESIVASQGGKLENLEDHQARAIDDLDQKNKDQWEAMESLISSKVRFEKLEKEFKGEKALRAYISKHSKEIKALVANIGEQKTALEMLGSSIASIEAVKAHVASADGRSVDTAQGSSVEPRVLDLESKVQVAETESAIIVAGLHELEKGFKELWAKVTSLRDHLVPKVHGIEPEMESLVAKVRGLEATVLTNKNSHDVQGRYLEAKLKELGDKVAKPDQKATRERLQKLEAELASHMKNQETWNESCRQNLDKLSQDLKAEVVSGAAKHEALVQGLQDLKAELASEAASQEARHRSLEDQLLNATVPEINQRIKDLTSLMDNHRAAIDFHDLAIGELTGMSEKRKKELEDLKSGTEEIKTQLASEATNQEARHKSLEAKLQDLIATGINQKTQDLDASTAKHQVDLLRHDLHIEQLGRDLASLKESHEKGVADLESTMEQLKAEYKANRSAQGVTNRQLAHDMQEAEGDIVTNKEAWEMLQGELSHLAASHGAIQDSMQRIEYTLENSMYHSARELAHETARRRAELRNSIAQHEEMDQEYEESRRLRHKERVG